MASETDARGAVHKASDHYEAHTTESYESAFFYSPGEYMDYLQKLVRSTLKVQEHSKRRLVDIGGGTGNFTKMIVEGTDMDAVCVDPFLVTDDNDVGEGETSGDAKRTRRQLQFVKAPAEDFLKEFSDMSARPWWMRGYHQCLMKEIVHHVAKADRVGVFKGMRAGLTQVEGNGDRPPALLIMTRPQRDIDYPMWPEALDVWAANQPHVDDLKADLVAAGFTNVQHTKSSYRCSCKLTQWQDMVKKKFWSTFVEFTDAELAAGCEYIAKERDVDADGMISFEDRMILITADP